MIPPGAVTAAGILLILGGADWIIAGVFSGVDPVVREHGGGPIVGSGRVVVLLTIVAMGLGILELVAGIRIVGLSAGWRGIGLVLAGVGLAFGVLNVIFLFTESRGGDAVISIFEIGASAFVIWALSAYRGEFTGRPGTRYPYRQKTSGFAIAALVFGILGGLLSLIFGYIALSQIKGSGGRLGGRGLAIAGVSLGWIWWSWIIFALLAAIFEPV